MRKCLQILMCPRTLLNRLAPPTYQDLRYLIFKGDQDFIIKKIEDLIDDGAPLIGKGQTIFHCCINQKNIKMLQIFIERYPELVDQRNDDGDSPFMTAVFQKSDKAINLLVNKCNLNICDNNGNTAFIIAAANGDLLTLKLILRKDPQFQYVKNFDGQNALHRACYFGELETVSFLLRQTSLKFGMSDKKGNTSLHLACSGLSFGVARYIVKKVKNWTDLIVQNKQGKDPFDLMLQSISKIGDKNMQFSKEALRALIIGQDQMTNSQSSKIQFN